MFGFDSAELLLVFVLAFILISPKDFPVVLKKTLAVIYAIKVFFSDLIQEITQSVENGNSKNKQD